MSLPKISEILRLYGLSATKQLSQNFILDLNVTRKIAKTLGDNVDRNLVVEVGPGPGSLTRSILEYGVKDFIVVEKDSRFFPALLQIKSAFPFLQTIIGDILHTSDSSILADRNIKDYDKVQIIGNLPYNISVPLCIQYLDKMTHNTGLLSHPNVELILMFQKEVMERICARPNEKKFGRLAIVSQFAADVQNLYNFKPNIFTPAPKVHSSLVKFVKKTKRISDITVKQVEAVSRLLFHHPRKTLRFSLKKENYLDLINKEMPEVVGMRPFELQVEQFVRIAEIISSHNQTLK